jgi:phosphoserine phosphatase
MARSKDSKQVEDLQKVLAISRSMAATEDLDALLNLIIRRSMELLAAERATIFLYDAETDELISRIATGTGEIRIPSDSGLAGAAATSGEVINVPDAYADDRFNPDVDRQTGFKTRNILSIPMHDYQEHLVGVLQVLNKLEGSFEKYDIALAETLAAQAGVAIQRANLIEHFLEKQRMQRAMEIARDIQQRLLPGSPPEIDGFKAAGFSRPADETGGDTYDFMQLPTGEWVFVVADATGHGVGPAIVITETRAMLRAICVQAAGELARGAPDVSSVLRTVNDLLIVDLDEGRFVTCFLGLLDPAKRTLTYASAGHGPLLFYKRSDDTFETASATSIPLGVVGKTSYSETGTRTLESGDFAVIITDGFIEAIGQQGKEFGVARTCELLRSARDLPPDEMIQKLDKAVTEFTNDQPQADDLTAVIIRKT